MNTHPQQQQQKKKPTENNFTAKVLNWSVTENVSSRKVTFLLKS